MAIQPGARFGSFEVVSRIGVGGMGEVYLARDSRLGREVAIKVLPEAMARDAERLARFDREARALASLSHPNVGAIHGAEEADGVRFLVLELIPGDTLGDLIDRGPIPVDEALRLASQIAAAVEAAHERGIVHRDLKPANVKVTPDGRVKVLDFGLARMLAPVGDSGELARTMDGDHETKHGVLIGTPTYMSPEQARGQTVDKRSDVWAFGCVLYEMLTGRKAFAGETMTDVLAGILAREPDWHALPARAPRGLRKLLGRCLQRDRERRLHDIADARIEIEEMLAALASGIVEPDTTGPGMGRRQVLLLVGAGAAAGALGAAGAFTLLRRTGADTRGLRFNVAIPAEAPLMDVFEAYAAMALAPDGRTLAFVGSPGTSSLWVRPLDATRARQLPGTTNGLTPFFSPDGKWIGFAANGMLRKTHVETGEPQAICPAGRLRGACWAADGRIVFAVFSGGLMAVDAMAGSGAPRALTTVDTGRQEAHRWPDVLPGGRGVLFASVVGNDRNVAAVGPTGGDVRTLVQGGNCPRYLKGGYLVFARSGTLMAAPFDARTLKLKGTPVPVVEDVRMVTKGSGGAHYAISASGALAYVPGYPRPPERTLLWVDASGKAQPLGAERKPYLAPRLSPDGSRLAVVIETESSDIWTYELERGTWTRLTFEGDNTQPIWSPDGRRLAFASNRDGAYQLYVVAAEGGAARQVTSGREWRFPSGFSPDGRRVACNSNSDQKADVVLVDVDSGALVPLGTKARYEGNAVFSPDGAWIAYQADEGSGYQILVTEAGGGGRRWPVSGGQASEPMWSPDGRQIFFRSGSGFYAADVQARPDFHAARPRRLFELGLEAGDSGLQNYDVSRDGSRLLAVQGPTTVQSPLEIVYVPDFAAEVAAKLKA